MIIAIDGPAGSGKSSTAREVARRLDFAHVDSGAFYRALTHALLAAGVPESAWAGLTTDDLDRFRIDARRDDGGLTLTLHDEPLDTELRTQEVNARVSHVARIPAVREWLLARLRAQQDQDLVIDGRDIGTVVFPDAELKIFLVADPETRARRRLAERGTDSPDADTLRDEVERLLERDRLDSQREVAPLTKADDAVGIDTTALTFDEQVEAILALTRARRG